MWICIRMFFVGCLEKRCIHNGPLLYHDTFTPVHFVKVSEHAGTSKYRDESIGASSTCFLQIITVPSH